MSDDSRLPTDDEIIAAAVQHKRDVREKRNADILHIGTGFPLLQDGLPVAWVKYTDCAFALEAEAETQAYIYETLNQQPALLEFIRVPKILRIIAIDDDEIVGISTRKFDDPPWVMVVMEYVHGDTVRQCLKNEDTEERRDRFWGQILGALNALLNLQPLPNTPPGPDGGGRIEHLVFGEYAEPEFAPRDFDSAQDLENFINETIGIEGVEFASEDLKLCHCDPHQSNFIVPHEGGSIYMIDFGHCFWLPPSFMWWALRANWRDEIFDYLLERLPALQQLSERNRTVLSTFNVKNVLRERRYWNPPPK